MKFSEKFNGFPRFKVEIQLQRYIATRKITDFKY